MTRVGLAPCVQPEVVAACELPLNTPDEWWCPKYRELGVTVRNRDVYAP